MGTPITKNLGLIKAIHKGINPPINIAMLWYDVNPGVNIHKYYDTVLLEWLPLSNSSGSIATYTKGKLIIAIGNMNYPKGTPNQFEIDENGAPYNCSDFTKKEYIYDDFINIFWNIGSLKISANRNVTVKVNNVIVYVNVTDIDMSLSEIQDIKELLDRGQDCIIEFETKDSFNFYLPTPRISYVSTGQQNVNNLVHNSPSYEWANIIESIDTDLSNPEDYFKRYFDIYFDNYGNNEWRQLPELRVELCMLKYKGRNTGWRKLGNPKNTSSSISRTTKIHGLRDKFQKAIIHPRHVLYDDRFSPGTTSNTFFSGGDGGNHPTEWNFDFETVNNITTNLKYSNRAKNTNIRLMIDILGFIKSDNMPYYSFVNIVASPQNIYFKNTGYLKSLGFGNTNIKQRSFKFYFRLSAADPTSWNSLKNRYDSRLYSDYSKCIIATPKSINTDGMMRKFKQLDIKIL